MEGRDEEVKEPAPSLMILNAYPTVDTFWYNGWTYITYKNQGHYSLDVFPEKDRYVEIIGNLNGNSTGYAEFTNFTIYEI